MDLQWIMIIIFSSLLPLFVGGITTFVSYKKVEQNIVKVSPLIPMSGPIVYKEPDDYVFGSLKPINHYEQPPFSQNINNYYVDALEYKTRVLNASLNAEPVRIISYRETFLRDYYIGYDKNERYSAFSRIKSRIPPIDPEYETILR